MSPFIQLIQTALGLRNTLDDKLDAETWARVFDTAKKQAVLGVTFKGIEKLPADQLPPLRTKLQWALAAEKIGQNNAEIDSHAAEITKTFEDMGIRSCVLKGQGAAMLYPWPEARQSGDIDLWIDLPCRKAVPVLKQKWTVGDVFYHHADVRAFTDGTELEVHFRPSWMNSPISNRRLQRYFKSKAPEQFGNGSGKGFNCPTDAFNCVFSLIHIYRHLLQEGIGMRQLMDYCFILKSSSEPERKAAYNFVSKLGMKKFCGALMYALEYFFALEPESMLCPPDGRYGEFLVDEVMKSGNFGHFDSRNRYSRKQPLIIRFINRMKHLARFTGIAWSEVLWAPYFKTRQLIWRKINNY